MISFKRILGAALLVASASFSMNAWYPMTKNDQHLECLYLNKFDEVVAGNRTIAKDAQENHNSFYKVIWFHDGSGKCMLGNPVTAETATERQTLCILNYMANNGIQLAPLIQQRRLQLDRNQQNAVKHVDLGRNKQSFRKSRWL